MKVLGRIFLNSCKKGHKDVKTERRSFFVRCRRTYVLNKCLISTKFYANVCSKWYQKKYKFHITAEN